MRTVVLFLLLSGAASAEQLALNRLDAGREVISPKQQALEEEEAPLSRYPKVWYPIEEPAKPKPRGEAKWAQDGYLFKYSF